MSSGLLIILCGTALLIAAAVVVALRHLLQTLMRILIN